MNSYTLTFKRKIQISFIVILVNLIILDIGLYFIAKMKSTKTTFINDKFSRIDHFKLNNPKNQDIIFIGSSRTFYQISTNTFKGNNLNIYNYGIAGAGFEDYPSVVSSINNKHTKHIVLSLQVNNLYEELHISDYPIFNEIIYYYHIDKIKFFKSIYTWIVNRHVFLQYSEPIYKKLISYYDKFEYNKENIKLKSIKKDYEVVSINKSVNYSKLVGCTVFDIKQTNDSKITLKCSNGDGMFIGNNIISYNSKVKLKDINIQSIKFLQQLTKNIKNKDIKLTIILEPVFHNKYIYDINKIKKQFRGIEIIDLTNFEADDNLWADVGHFNYKGREKYSTYLSNIFNKNKEVQVF